MSTIPTKFLSLVSPPKSQAASGAGAAASPAQALLAAVEAQLEHLPLARSRPVQEGAPQGVKAPVVAGRTVSVVAPPPVTEEELVERLAAAADPFFQERERAEGEVVAEGDAVLLSWEARANGGAEPFIREEQVEGRVLPDPALPGFYEGLVGQKVGSKVQYTSVLPEDFPEPAARGGRVDFTVQIHRARERTAPDTESPEFLKALGRGSTIQEVMDSLGEQALEERRQEMDDEARLQLLEQLAQEVQAFVPGEWVTIEMREQWKAYQLLAKARGGRVEPFDSWQANAQVRREVEMKLRLDLALQALCAQEKVRSGPEDEAQLVEALARPLGVGVEELRKALGAEPSAERLVKKAAWFIRAADHLLGQVRVEVVRQQGAIRP